MVQKRPRKPYHPFQDVKRAIKRKATPQPIQGTLNSALARAGIAKDLARYQFVLRWAEIVGEDIAARTKPEALRGDTLVVRVCDSAWAQELTFQKDVILNRLERFFGDDCPRDLTFYVG